MTTAEPARAEFLRRSLGARLEATGALRDPAWRSAFDKVPRHVFVPEFWTHDGTTRRRVTAADSDWLELVYTDEALTTQWTGRIATSSSTAPWLMVAMLQALDVRDGHRVLEVATGTGYNAALLAERLGPDLVTTIEVDPGLARSAQERLRQAGYNPTVVVGDGRDGHGSGAPYDRLVATCGFRSVPYAWVGQVSPGGTIVSPVGAGTVRLTVRGGDATGRFLSLASYFMPVRSIATTGTSEHPGRPQSPAARESVLTPDDFGSDEHFRFLVSLIVPGISHGTEDDGSGGVDAVELWTDDGSWARVADGVALQAGPRRLWDQIEVAHALYERHGRPDRERFGLTVTAASQSVWLDREDQPVTCLGTGGGTRGPR